MAFGRVEKSEQPEDQWKQDRREHPIETHAKSGKGTSDLIDLKRASGSDSMRGNAHRQAHDTRVVNTRKARNDGPENGTGDAGHDHEYDRERLQAAR